MTSNNPGKGNDQERVRDQFIQNLKEKPMEELGTETSQNRNAETCDCALCEGKGCSTCPNCLDQIYDWDHPHMVQLFPEAATRMVDIADKMVFDNEVSKPKLSICAVPGCENKPNKVIWRPPEYEWAFVCGDCRSALVEDGVMRLSLVSRAVDDIVPRGVPMPVACLGMDVYAIVQCLTQRNKIPPLCFRRGPAPLWPMKDGIPRGRAKAPGLEESHDDQRIA